MDDRDRERINAEEQQVTEAVIAQLELRFAGLKGQIEMIDVATPIAVRTSRILKPVRCLCRLDAQA